MNKCTKVAWKSCGVRKGLYQVSGGEFRGGHFGWEVRASEVGRQGGQGAERVPGRQHHGRQLTHSQDLTSKTLWPTSRRKKLSSVILWRQYFLYKKGQSNKIYHIVPTVYVFYEAACTVYRLEYSLITTKQCCGSMTFWQRCGTGTVGTVTFWLVEPEPQLVEKSEPEPYVSGTGTRYKTMYLIYLIIF